MKNKSYIIITILVCFCIVISTILLDSNQKDNKEDNYSYTTEQDLLKDGEYNYELELGNKVSLQTLIDDLFNDSNNTNYNTFELISNSDNTVVSFNKEEKEFIALNEGKNTITFKINEVIIKVNFKVISTTSNAEITEYNVPLKPSATPNFKVLDYRTRDVAGVLQNIAITNLNKSNQLIWYSYRCKNQSDCVYAFNKKNQSYFKGIFKHSGHGQSFDVSPNTHNSEKYNVYIGTQYNGYSGTANNTYGLMKLNVRPRKEYTNKKKIYKTDANENGYFISKNSKGNYLKAEASYDDTTSMLAIRRGGRIEIKDIKGEKHKVYRVEIYKIDRNRSFKNQNNIKPLSERLKNTIHIPSLGSPNGTDMLDNNYYFMFSLPDGNIRISCIKNDKVKRSDGGTGTIVWETDVIAIKDYVDKYIKDHKIKDEGRREAEGIKVYKLNNTTYRFYIGYKFGHNRRIGIIYFDIPVNSNIKAIDNYANLNRAH